MRRRNEKSKTEEKRTGERENGEITRNRKKQGEVKGAFRNDGTKMEDREKTSVGVRKKLRKISTRREEDECQGGVRKIESLCGR